MNNRIVLVNSIYGCFVFKYSVFKRIYFNLIIIIFSCAARFPLVKLVSRLPSLQSLIYC